MFDYSGVGGHQRERKLSEGMADIPMNRTLLIQKLTDEPPAKPQVVEGLTTVEDVFAHFKPKVTVEFEKEDGSSVEENIRFSNLGDFGPKGLERNSEFLHELNSTKEELFRFIKQLKSNKILQKVLSDEQSKAAYIDSLKGLLNELNAAG
jgi:hypothetical protein